VWVPALVESDCAGTACWSVATKTDSAASCILGREYAVVWPWPPTFRYWCPPSRPVSSRSLDRSRRWCDGGPWCRKALCDGGDSALFQSGDWRWAGFGWRGAGGDGGGTCGVVAPRSRAVSQFIWPAHHSKPLLLLLTVGKLGGRWCWRNAEFWISLRRMLPISKYKNISLSNKCI